MRHLTTLLVLLALAGCATTAPPAGTGQADPFVFVGSQELNARIAEATVENHLSAEVLFKGDEHSALEVFRDGTGEAEYHEKDTDFWVVRDGEAELVYGGEIVEPRTTGPAEIRGSSIRGGTKRVIRTGDIVNIPPRMSHQLIVEDGRSITYLIVKIRER